MTISCQEREGNVKEYYEHGYIKYSGYFQDGLRTGTHYQYFADTEGRVQYEVDYQIKEGKEFIVSSKKYDRDKTLIFESKRVHKDLEFYGQKNVLLRDTFKLRIRIPDPKYEFSDVHWGAYDQNLNVVDSTQIYYEVGFNHEVVVPITANRLGENVLKGYVSDFTIVPISDSIGYTKSEDTYFEYEYLVIDSKTI